MSNNVFICSQLLIVVFLIYIANRNNWGFPRSTSPFGIDGLSPQADDVVENRERDIPISQSPIGTDNQGFGSPSHQQRGESPPQHILNIFR